MTELKALLPTTFSERRRPVYVSIRVLPDQPTRSAVGITMIYNHILNKDRRCAVPLRQNDYMSQAVVDGKVIRGFSSNTYDRVFGGQK